MATKLDFSQFGTPVDAPPSALDFSQFGTPVDDARDQAVSDAQRRLADEAAALPPPTAAEREDAEALFRDAGLPPTANPFAAELARRTPAAAAVAGDDPPGAISRGFVTGLIEQNPAMMAETLEGLSYLGPEQFRGAFSDASKDMRGLMGAAPDAYKPRGKGLFESKNLDEALTWAGEAFGQGVASTIPSIVTGSIGAAAGSRVGGRVGATAGGLGGAAIPSAALNYGEVYKALKDEKVAPKIAAEYAAVATGPMVALDTLSIGPIIARLGGAQTVRREIARSIARRVAAEAAKGAGREGVTEAAQEAVKEATVSIAADKPFWTVETAKKIAESGVAGALVGGPMGGVGGIVPDAAPPAGAMPVPEMRDDAPPPLPEGVPEGATPAEVLIGEEMAALSPDDLASPLHNRLIAGGRAAIRAAIRESAPQDTPSPAATPATDGQPAAQPTIAEAADAAPEQPVAGEPIQTPAAPAVSAPRPAAVEPGVGPAVAPSPQPSASPSPSFADFLAALPLDANGEPDISGAGAQAIARVAGEPTPWAKLTSGQKMAAVAALRGEQARPAAPPAKPSEAAVPWTDLTDEQRKAAVAAENDANFEAVRAKEPGLTREEYEKRRAAGKAMFGELVGEQSKPDQEPAAEAPAPSLDDLLPQARGLIGDRKKALNVRSMARHLGTDEVTARRVLNRFAATGVIRQSKTGTGFMRKPRRGPMDVLQYIASLGGVKDDGGDLRAMDAHKRLVPGFGPIVRPTGRGIDEMGESLWEAGYFGQPPGPAGTEGFGVERPSVREVIDLIDRALRGEKVYSTEDEQEVREREEAKAETERAKASKAAAGELDAAAKGAGIELSADERERAIDEIMDGADPVDVLDDIAERQAIQLEDRYEKQPDTDEAPPFPDAASERPAAAGDAARREARGPEGDAEARQRQREDRPDEAGASGEGQPGRVAPTTESTPQGDQTVMPGMERSARQAQQARDKKGGIQPKTRQKEADEGLFAEKPDERQADIEDEPKFSRRKEEAPNRGARSDAGSVERGKSRQEPPTEGGERIGAPRTASVKSAEQIGRDVAEQKITAPRDVAEHLAAIARGRLGSDWRVGTSHSSTQVGDSSYITIMWTGPFGFVRWEGRVSDHSTGVVRTQDYGWLAGSSKRRGEPISASDAQRFIESIDRLPDRRGRHDITKAEWLERQIALAEQELNGPVGKQWGNARRREGQRRIDRLRRDLATERTDAPKFSRRAEPAFFSALTRAVEGMKTAKAPGRQWIGTIRNAPGVKAEEVEWSGVNEWLESRKGPVTKDDLLTFLRENEVKVEEVVRGGRVPPQAVDRIRDWVRRNIGVADDELEIREGFQPGYSEADFEQLQRGDAESLGKMEELGVPDELLSPVYDNINQGASKFGGPNTTLPGGENYRELLLTLPYNWRKAGWRVVEVATGDFKIAGPGGDPSPTGQLFGSRAEAEAVMGRSVGDEDFRAGHFDEPNVLAHIRFNERTDADGKRVLFIEEVQSDWHQKGRAQGYNDQRERDALVAKINRGEQLSDAEEARRKALLRGEGVPSAPFKSSWHELAMKRALRWAAENGFDSVAWTTGAMQAERYDLSKELDRIDVRRNPDASGAVTATGNTGAMVLEGSFNADGILTSGAQSGENLADVFGKEMAEKIMAAPMPEADGFKVINRKSRNKSQRFGTRAEAEAALRSYPASLQRDLEVMETVGPQYRATVISGDGLKIGGEGMRGFYDVMLPAFANKYGKKWGARVGRARITTEPHVASLEEYARRVGFAPQEIPDGIRAEYEKSVRRYAQTVHTLPITPQMRESVLQGQPLFKQGETPATREGDTVVTERLRGGAGEVRYHYSDAFEADRAAVEKAVRAELGKLNLGSVGVRVSDRIQAIIRGERFEADGRYLRGLIDIALTAPDIIKAARHEAIHALREFGLFAKSEWSVLNSAAVKMWREKYDIDARYPNLSESEKNEEAIAEAFAHWRAGAIEARGILLRLFNRIRRVLEAIGNALRGRGFQTVEDVFERIERGEVGARDGREAGREAAFSATEDGHRGAARQIAEIIKTDPIADYGLRVIPGEIEGDIAVGDRLPPSRVWDDGVVTDDVLPGTSAIFITPQTFDGVVKAIRHLGAHGRLGPNGYYAGSRVVLIKGDTVGSGEDLGEVIFRDAEVLGIWHKPDDGNSEVQPNRQPRFFASRRDAEADVSIEAKFSLRPADAETNAGRQRAAQNMLAKGQPIDRALRLPFDWFGGVNARGEWQPAARLQEAHPYMVAGALIGARAGAFVTNPLGAIAGKAAGRLVAGRAGSLAGEAVATVAGGLPGAAAGAAIGSAAGRLMETKFSDTGPFSWLNPALETARRGLIDRYGLSEQYVTRERRRDLDERKLALRGMEILRTLRDSNIGSAEAQVLQAVLTGEQIPSAEWERISGPIRQAIDEMGQEAVLLGLVSRESYERNKGTYLHRVYRKHETDTPALARWVGDYMGRRRKRIVGDAFKGRGMFMRVDIGRAMRDVTEFAEGRRGKPVKGEKIIVLDKFAAQDSLPGVSPAAPKIEKRVYWPADKPIPDRFRDFVSEGEWEVRYAGDNDLVLWRDFTKAERVKMGEITDARYTIARTFMLMAHDLATGRFYKDIAENGEWTRSVEPPTPWRNASEYGRYWNDTTVQWVKVPDTDIPQSGGKKRWGALSGKYVRAEIWRDLNELDQMSKPRTWQKIVTSWKLMKALALDTPIPTPDGWTTMGEIRAGDRVFDEKGQICTVLEAKDVQYGRPCYEVSFSDGTKIVADEDHWWFTLVGGKGAVRTTAEVLATLKERTRGDNKHSVPVAAALDLPTADLPIPPYALGIWLGDGDNRGPRISVGGDDLAEIVRHLTESGVRCTSPRKDKRNNVYALTMQRSNDRCIRGHNEKHRNPLNCGQCEREQKAFRAGGPEPSPVINAAIPARMDALDLRRNKHIPAIYLRASAAQRRELLMGLMDSDGCVTEKGECIFTTTTPKMRDGVMELVRSLGYKPTVRDNQTMLNGVAKKPSWVIYFRAYADRPVAKLSRKASRMKARPAARQRSGTRQIVAVTPIPSVPVRCIAVSSESSLYLAGDGMIPTHNTARAPVVHMNNVMSNLLFMDMADVRLQDLVRGIRAFVREDGDFQEARENGAFGADLISAEIRRDVLQPILDEIERDMKQGRPGVVTTAGVLGKVAEAIWKPIRAADRTMINMYRLEDEVFRMALYMRRLSMGDTPQHAAAEAREQFLDYDIRAPWVNWARRSVLPFISYTYRAVPVIAKSMANRPWKMAKYFTIAYVANMLAYMAAPGDEDDERRSLRDEEQGYTWIGTPRMARMPSRDAYGNPVFLDIRRWIPAGDVFDVGQGHGVFQVPAPLQLGGPLMIAGEMLLNRSAFTGEDIYNEKTDDWKDRLEKGAGHLYRSWIPSAAYIPGSWYWQKVGRTVDFPLFNWRKGTDGSDRPYTTGQALLSSIGIKVRPQDVEQEFVWKHLALKQANDALKVQARRIERDLGRNIISVEQANRAIGDLLEKGDRIAVHAITLDLGKEAGEILQRRLDGKITEAEADRLLSPLADRAEKNRQERARIAEEADRKRDATEPSP